MPVISAIRENYTEDCENLINRHINLELNASYTYLFLSYHFDQDDVALKGFQEYYKKKSENVKCRAEKLISYQNKRGGRLMLGDIKTPKSNTKGTSVLDILHETMHLEREINGSLLQIRNVARKHKDPQLRHYITSAFITDVVENIFALGKLITNVKRVGDKLGIYQLDKTYF